MTDLHNLIDKSLSIYSKLGDGNIHVYVNGTPINIKLEVINDRKDKPWINMTFTKNV